MSELVGYVLTGPDGEIQRWGGTWGQCPGQPDVLFLPGDVQVHSAALDTPYRGGDGLDYTLSKLMMAAPAPTADDVWVEKDRRWSLGFDYDFGDARGVQHLATTVLDRANWQLVDMAARSLIQAGAGSSTINIYTETSGTTPVQVTATEWNSIVLAASAFFQNAIDKAAALIATPGGIPADYTSDSHWT